MSEEFFNPDGKSISHPRTVYIPVSGGLGDVVQVYLSDPATPEERAECTDKFTSGDPTHAIWFRRLESFKKQWPEVMVKLIMASHNARSAELFEYHPCIQEVIMRPYTTNVVVDGRYDWLSDDEYWYSIHHMYGGGKRYTQYKSLPPVVYMPAEEHKIVDSIVGYGKFILVHPFAGIRERMPYPLYKYGLVINRLVENGYNVVVVGGSFRKNIEGDDGLTEEVFRFNGSGVVNLVDKVSVRVSVALALKASGFVGTHSAMILPVWYTGAKTVCLVPPKHECGLPFEEFFEVPNPTTWGAKQLFNKTIVVNGINEISIEEIVGWFQNV